MLVLKTPDQCALSVGTIHELSLRIMKSTSANQFALDQTSVRN